MEPTNTRPDRAAPHALLSGGGSGGHVFPGLAVAEELRRRGWEVAWVGSSRGLEARLVGERGVEFHELPARPVLGQGPVAKLRAGLTLLSSAWKARALVRRLGSRVVIGTGGYVSAPAAVGGRLAGRPVLLIEPNAETGLANRLLSALASEAAVAYEATGERLRCPARLTGVPVRAAFHRIPEGLPPAPPLRLLVLGGSQGARQLNELLPAALGRLARAPETPSAVAAIAVCHQTGERHLEATRRAYREAGLGEGEGAEVEVTPFLDDVAAAMADSHLIVSRAGAITLAEICAAGRASLLVPLAIALGHQGSNARRLADAGAAEILPESAGEEELTEILARLLGDRERLAEMGRAARALARDDAAARIADRAEHLSKIEPERRAA